MAYDCLNINYYTHTHTYHEHSSLALLKNWHVQGSLAWPDPLPTLLMEKKGLGTCNTMTCSQCFIYWIPMCEQVHMPLTERCNGIERETWDLRMVLCDIASWWLECLIVGQCELFNCMLPDAFLPLWLVKGLTLQDCDNTWNSLSK